VTVLEVVPEDGSTYEALLAPVPDRLGLARGRGDAVGGTDEAVAWICIEGGEGRLRVGSLTAEIAGRADVFDEAGWSAIIPPSTGFSVEGDLRYTVVWRHSDRELDPRIFDPSEVLEEDRGSGPSARRVRTYVATGPLIVGETLNPPGGWSSFPPHRHEHEEVYLYRFSPPEGFGVAANYQDESEELAIIVHEGSVQRITRGYHPVASAPGYVMYYLWALAGESDELRPSFDPVHGGVA
jgi:5-deoxy-glucuronate isomerase